MHACVELNTNSIPISHSQRFGDFLHHNDVSQPRWISDIVNFYISFRTAKCFSPARFGFFWTTCFIAGSIANLWETNFWLIPTMSTGLHANKSKLFCNVFIKVNYSYSGRVVSFFVTFFEPNIFTSFSFSIDLGKNLLSSRRSNSTNFHSPS